MGKEKKGTKLVVTRCVKLIILLAALVLPVVAMAVSGAPFFNMNTEADNVSISYKVEDVDQSFWHSVRDALRAGEAIIVRHKVKVYQMRPWLPDARVARITAPLYVSYNLFEHRFVVGPENSRNRKLYFDEPAAEAAVLTMQHLQLPLSAPLESGTRYHIAVEVQMLTHPDNRGWQQYLPIESLFRPSITQEVEYVAP